MPRIGIYFILFFLPLIGNASTLLVGNYPGTYTYDYTQSDVWISQASGRQGGGFVFEASSYYGDIGVIEVPLCSPAPTTGSVYFNVYVNGSLIATSSDLDIDSIPTTCGGAVPAYVVASSTLSFSPTFNLVAGDVVYFALRSSNISVGGSVSSLNSKEIPSEFYDYVMATTTPYADGWNARIMSQFSGYNQAFFALRSAPSTVSGGNLSAIDISLPVSGSFVSGDSVDVLVNLSNVDNHNSVTVCVADVLESFAFTDSDVCYSRESYSLISGQTSLEFVVDVDSVASTTRSIFVWYGVSLDYLHITGLRGVDWDMVSVGFNNAAPSVDYRSVGSYGSKSSSWKCADASLMEFSSTTLCVIDYLFVPDYASLQRVASTTLNLLLNTFPINIVSGSFTRITDEMLGASTSTLVIAIPFPAPSGATTSLTIIDTSTIATDYPLLATVRSAFVYIIWLATGMYVLQTLGRVLHIFGYGKIRDY